MRTVAILQARMHSSRLPGKMLLPLLGVPLVRHVIERTRRATTLDFVVLAYPLADHAAFKPVIQSFANTPGVPLGSYAFPGDESDLVARYLGAARAYEADIICRIPCDNPAIDPEYIDKAVTEYLDGCHTFYSNTTISIPQPEQRRRLAVDGVGAEVLSLSRLKWLEIKTQGSPLLREHPHLWFYQRLEYIYPDGDDGILVPLPYRHEPTLRLDVNTQADYEFIKDIFDHFGHNRFTSAEVVAYLETKKVTA